MKWLDELVRRLRRGRRPARDKMAKTLDRWERCELGFREHANQAKLGAIRDARKELR